MPDSTTSPGASPSPNGPSEAERLDYLTTPDGPHFPLDDDLIAALQDYPGELPTSAEHFVALLPD
jgi:hypothetical protein